MYFILSIMETIQVVTEKCRRASIDFCLPVYTVDGGGIHIHQVFQSLEVVLAERREGNVSHGPELAAIVQMFVFEPEKVPSEPPNNFEQRKKCAVHNSRYNRVVSDQILVMVYDYST